MNSSIIASVSTACLLFAASAESQSPGERDAALGLLTSGHHAEAVDRYTDLTTTNPYDGVLWYYRGRAEVGADQCANAIASLSRALALGVSGDRSGLRAALISRAECHAMLGNMGAALADIGEAQARWDYSDFGRIADNPAFQELITTPQYRALVGILPDGATREQGWTADLDFMASMIERRHINAFHSIDRAAWLTEVARIRSRIPVAEDLELIGDMMRLAAALGDGHTAIFPPFAGPFGFHMASVRPTILDGEWYVLGADRDLPDLVGSRILKINNMPIRDYEAGLRAYISSDNSLTYRASGPLLTQFTEIAALVTSSPESDAITYEVELPDGQVQVITVQGHGFNPALLRAWPPSDMATMADAAEPPLWLSRPQNMLWMEYLEESDLLYLKLDAIFDAPDISFQQFVENFGNTLDETGAGHVVIDLRQNDGGDATRNWSLLREIVRRPHLDQPGKVFILIGRRTFSAAMIFAAQAERILDVVFVGSPTASSLTFYGETSVSQLPYSGLQLSVSSRYFQNGASSDDNRPWIAPTMIAELSAEDLIEGRDPAMDAVLRHLAGR